MRPAADSRQMVRGVTLSIAATSRQVSQRSLVGVVVDIYGYSLRPLRNCNDGKGDHDILGDGF